MIRSSRSLHHAPAFRFLYVATVGALAWLHFTSPIEVALLTLGAMVLVGVVTAATLPEPCRHATFRGALRRFGREHPALLAANLAVFFGTGIGAVVTERPAGWRIFVAVGILLAVPILVLDRPYTLEPSRPADPDSPF
ncbi:MAG TPA: hypothetical protein RMH85_34725 [Polyangiaceae bacterium LLY-WYZ-15_(1-7)]|nr:hypothetical protein [Myxococcales bacterium]MAT25413.1 hypothetical protein [Sandaracinus sp.]HJK95557.1 hypothetical protein [Polyangiaceae bacterium LLY-WYZ-15_(1-7)]MBJ74615.1 hypothetical protein [Sandaracinus sp.]HJL00191.1 hypothetical protein [Polyangiaceae bacterium LLY-WYZ-15_(1-7)]